MSKYKLGDAVLFINGYGETYSEKMWRWGNVALGFITNIEYISGDRTIYVVGCESPVEPLKPTYRTLGEHLLFSPEEKDKAFVKLYELCEEPDDED